MITIQELQVLISVGVVLALFCFTAYTRRFITYLFDKHKRNNYHHKITIIDYIFEMNDCNILASIANIIIVTVLISSGLVVAVFIIYSILF